MSKIVRFGVGIPTGTEGLMYPVPFINDVRDNIDISVRAEELGFDGVWGNDHVATQKYVTEAFRQAPKYYAPLITLAAIAERTERITIGTALLVLPFREPGPLAKELATLDELSCGRLRVAVGIGAYREEFRAIFGSAAEGKKRGEMMDEALIILHRLFTEDNVSFDGKYYKVADLNSTPKPVSRPFPLYIGGNGMPGMKRAAKYAQGWMPSGFTVAETAERVRLMKTLLEEQGREDADFDIAQQFTVCLGRTEEEAWEKYTASQQYRHMLSLASSTMSGLDLDDCVNRDLIGTPAHLIERIGEYLDAGQTSFPALLFTADSLPAFYDEMQWFAEDVMCAFSGK